MNGRQAISIGRAALGIAEGRRAFGGPLEASISLSNRCNLRCIHCFFHSPFLERPANFEVRRARREGRTVPDLGEVRRGQELDADPAVTRTLLDDLLRMGTRRFHFSGSGEPFMHPDALDFFARIKRKGARCAINTNGILLGRAEIEALVRMGVDELRITTLAGSAEMYARSHPGAPPETFDRLETNLAGLAELKKSFGRKRPRVKLNFIALAGTEAGLDDFADFAARVGAASLVFQAFDSVGDPGLARLMPDPAAAAAFTAGLARLRPRLEERGLAHNIDQFGIVHRAALDTTGLYRMISCHIGWTWVRVQVGGRVYPCNRCYAPLGDLNERPIAEIWRGGPYRRFRREAVRINRRGTPVDGCSCGSCCHYTINMKVYRALHPIRGRRLRLGAIRGEGEALWPG